MRNASACDRVRELFNLCARKTYGYAITVSTESLDPFVFLHVPDADPLVLPAAREVLAVRADRYGPDLVRVPIGVYGLPRFALALVDAALVERVRLPAGV